MATNYISPREKRVDAIVAKLFGEISPDLCAIVKADLMSKTDSPENDDNVNEPVDENSPVLADRMTERLVEANRPLLQSIKDENQKFFASLGHLEMTYDAYGQLHTVTQTPNCSSNK